jgi:DNA polymerase-1
MEDPNLLAFPARDEMGRKVRSCFIPQPGNKFVSVDFSQLEPRIVAALSRDPKLLKIYEGTDGDIYTGCAKDLGISRTAAKILTLGMLYGMTAKRLQSQLQIVGTHTELDACEALIDTWFATYEGVETLVHRVVHHAQECGGWAYTEGGRGRFLPGLFIDGRGYPAEMMREEANRQAFNHLVQGTGMEQLKHAMLRADEACPEYPMVLAIHDEVIFEVPSDDDEAEERLATAMYTEFYGVPLITKSTVGDDWGSLKS